MTKARTVITAKDTGERLSPREGIVFRARSTGEKADVQLLPEREFQQMLGFGGAFTEAAAYTLSRMSPGKRAEVIRRYFHPEEGLNYSMGRVHIHSCDFALGNYTYVQDGDSALATFDISHDHQWVIPLIKDAMDVKGGPLTMLASP